MIPKLNHYYANNFWGHIFKVNNLRTTAYDYIIDKPVIIRGRGNLVLIQCNKKIWNKLYREVSLDEVMVEML